MALQIRKQSYADYGLSKAEIRRIKEFCLNANDNDRELIENALSELKNPYMERLVLRNLTTGESFEKIAKKEYILSSISDCYAYKRKGTEAIKRWMILYGIWEM